VQIQTATSNGRTLTFAQWGDRDGFPVFTLHGTPGSRLLRHYDESKYAQVGARVITYDRPGYGGSDRSRGRGVVDCVADVAAIADTLGVERFAVTGGSGGGPHALAVAARLPDRVTRASCEVGIVPYPTPDFDWFEGMDPLNVKEFGWALGGENVLVPELEREVAELLVRVAADPSKLLGDDWELSEADRTELARVEYHDIIRQASPRRFGTAPGAGSTTTSVSPGAGASSWPRSVYRRGSSTASPTCSARGSTANGWGATSRTPRS